MAHDTTGPARRRKPDRAKISIKGSWTAIPNKLLTDRRLSRDARLLGCMIFMHAANRGTAFPSQEDLAEEMSSIATVISTDPETKEQCVSYEERPITVRSVQRWLTELRKTGWMDWRQTMKNNEYTLLDPSETDRDARASDEVNTASQPDNEVLTGATAVSPRATEGSHSNATERSGRATAVSWSTTTERSGRATERSYSDTTQGSSTAIPVSYSATQGSPSTLLESDSLILDSSSSESIAGDGATNVPTPTELFLTEENLGVAKELRDMPLDLAQRYVTDAKQRGASLPAIAKGLRARWKRELAKQHAQAAQLDPPEWVAQDAWSTLPPDLQLALDGSTVDGEGYLCYFERHEATIVAHDARVKALLRQARSTQAVGGSP